MTTTSRGAAVGTSYTGPYASLVNPAARANGLDPWWLAAVLYVENRFRTVTPAGSAGARAGSAGIAQINLPAHPDVTLAQANNPAFAIPWAARELATLKRQAGGSLAGALRGYNTGSTAPSAAGTAYVDQVDAAHRELRAKLGATVSANGYAAPVAADARFQRVDQGVDYTQSGPYRALAAGVVTRISRGFTGGTGLGVYYRFDQPVTVNGRSYDSAYVAETTPLVKPGDRVTAGQPIASGGAAELGFARGGVEPAAALVGGLGAGTQPTTAGHDFLSFVGGIVHGASSAAGDVAHVAATVATTALDPLGLFSGLGGGVAGAIGGVGTILETVTNPTKLQNALLWMLFVAIGVGLIFVGLARLFAPERRELDPNALALFQGAPGGDGGGGAAALEEAAPAAVLA